MNSEKNQRDRKPFNWMGGSELMEQTERQVSEKYGQAGQQATNVMPSGFAAGNEPAKEPTKGVQADVPMSLYLRLNAIKYRRNQPLCVLMVEALQMWADVQEGK